MFFINVLNNKPVEDTKPLTKKEKSFMLTDTLGEEMQNNTTPETLFVDINRAAEILGRTSQAVRGLILRKKLKAEKFRGQIRIDVQDCLEYQARKKDIPAFDKAPKDMGPYIPLYNAASRVALQPSYLMQLIKTNKLLGFVMPYGEVMISVPSLNTYFKAPINDVSDF
jgi:hypothetical protein